jgi:hypothetical protein
MTCAHGALLQFMRAGELQMNINVEAARIGQWYRHLDKGDIFLVTGYDEKSRTIETQTVDGDLDEIDGDAWSTLPLELAEPPEDWTEAIDDVNVDDEDSPIPSVEKILRADV